MTWGWMQHRNSSCWQGGISRTRNRAGIQIGHWRCLTRNGCSSCWRAWASPLAGPGFRAAHRATLRCLAPFGLQSLTPTRPVGRCALVACLLGDGCTIPRRAALCIPLKTPDRAAALTGQCAGALAGVRAGDVPGARVLHSQNGQPCLADAKRGRAGAGASGARVGRSGDAQAVLRRVAATWGGPHTPTAGQGSGRGKGAYQSDSLNCFNLTQLDNLIRFTK